MKISPDTKDSILFIGGCVGMAAFGLVLPILGYGFNFQLFAAWAAVAGIGLFGGLDSRRKGNNGTSS